MSDEEQEEGGSPSLRSNASGPPPSAQGQQTSAQQLQATHPLWARSRGQPLPGPPGRGGPGTMRQPPRGGSGGSQTGDAPRFEPLSALQLELESFRRNADGDSALFSEEASDHSLARPPRRKRRAEEEEGEEGEEDDGGFSALVDSEAGSEAVDDAPRAKRKKRRRGEHAGTGNDDATMFAQAAFGGGHGGGGASSDGESVSQLSGTSSTRKKAAFKAAFPVKGVDCVGCALVKKIAPVEKFIKDHMNKMAEEALWKMAALTYVREVQEPRRREGVLSPDVSGLPPPKPITVDSHSSPRDYVSTSEMAVGVEGRAQPLPAPLLGQHHRAHLYGQVAPDRAVQHRVAAHPRYRRRARGGQGGVRTHAKGARARSPLFSRCVQNLPHPSLPAQLIKEESAQRQLLGGGGGGSGGTKKQPGGTTVGDAK